MEIPEVPNPPSEYEAFALRRLLWREIGAHYDDMTVREVQEAVLFLELEREHPHRFERAQREMTRKSETRRVRKN